MMTFKFTTVTGGKEYVATVHAPSQLEALVKFVGLMVSEGYDKNTACRWL